MNNASTIKKPIAIKIVTDIRDGHMKETTAVEAQGTYYKKDEVVYLTYTEHQEEVGDIKTLLKIKEDEVTINRTGAVKMKQSFRKKVKLEGTYMSPYGRMDMMTYAHNIEYKKLQKRGHLFFTYDLTLQGQSVGKYAVTITFKEEEYEHC
ncbi:DUF1934 domain-containing protein [Priestia flexa]|uniref:DUF1934 domain-containing protein n=1 Tax=Priestia flexa TaxID=86664 RepID=UPI0039B37643